MRTTSAPTTALSGRNISEDSLAISTAILAAPYAVFQPDSLEDPGSLGAVSERSQEGEPIDKAIALDETASVLGSLVLENVRTTSFFMNSIGDVGVGGGLFIGVADDEGFPHGWCMVGNRTRCRRHLPRRHLHGWNADRNRKLPIIYRSPRCRRQP
jgi:hypothetical protein